MAGWIKSMNTANKKRIALLLSLAICAVLVGLIYAAWSRFSAYESIRLAIDDGNEDAAIQKIKQIVHDGHFDADWSRASTVRSAPGLSFLYMRFRDYHRHREESLTLLHHAARKGHARLVTILLANGASISVENDQGRDALGSAIVSGDTNIIGIMLRGGANVNATGAMPTTSMHAAAAFSKKTEVLELLINAGADINAMGQIGQTPLDLATSMRNTNAIPFLLAHGAVHGKDLRP